MDKQIPLSSKALYQGPDFQAPTRGIEDGVSAAADIRIKMEPDDHEKMVPDSHICKSPNVKKEAGGEKEEVSSVRQSGNISFIPAGKDKCVYSDGCKLDCKEHTEHEHSVSFDNTEPGQGHSCPVGEKQVAGVIDKQVPGTQTVESPGDIETDKEKCCCAKDDLCFHKHKIVQPPVTQFDQLSDVLPGDKSHGVDKLANLEGGTSGTELTSDSNTESEIAEDVACLGATDHQERVSDVCETQKLGNVILQSKRCRKKSRSFLSAYETTWQDCDTDKGSVLPSRVDIKKQAKLSKEETPYKCDDCGVSFFHLHHLKRHKTKHAKEKMFTCDVCGDLYTDSTRLRAHKRTHKEKLFKCDDCGVGFAWYSKLLIHKRVHTGEKLYKCVVCGEAFAYSGSLKTHERIHTGEKPFGCDICGVSFSHSGTLKKHIMIHTGEKPYKCDDCGAEFSMGSKLTVHRRIHTREKPYKCPICDASFAHNSNLKAHERIHTGEKPYRCDVCGVSFAHSGSLRKHIRTHTEEKLYKCEVCSVEFSVYSKLTAHRRLHTGEKLYKCDLCCAFFAHASNLITHKRTHTGERPLKCDVCGDGFAQYSTLYRHKRKHVEKKSSVMSDTTTDQ